MNNFKDRHFEVDTITVSNKLHFAYRVDHASFEGDTVGYKMEEKEKPHPDLRDAINAATQAYANAIGYDTENDDAWLAFKPKKIYISGLVIKVDLEIVIFNAETIKVTDGPQMDGLGEVVAKLKGEAVKYITGQKRTNGVKFEQKELFVGQAPEEYAPEEPEMDQQAAESDLDYEEEHEEQREPALV